MLSASVILVQNLAVTCFPLSYDWIMDLDLIVNTFAFDLTSKTLTFVGL